MVLICCFLAILVIVATVVEALEDTTSDSVQTSLSASPKTPKSPVDKDFTHEWSVEQEV